MKRMGIALILIVNLLNIGCGHSNYRTCDVGNFSGQPVVDVYVPGQVPPISVEPADDGHVYVQIPSSQNCKDVHA